MTPKPLSVDPDRLGVAGGELLTAAGQLPSAPPPFMPVGTDPLSVAIIGQIPGIELPVSTLLPKVQAESTKTATSVVGAAEAYTMTDQQLGGDISKEMRNAAAVGSGGPASGAGSMGGQIGQMMGMVGQVAQMPVQAMGAVAAVPQGIMQGAQQVGQQVQQMVGQFGQGATGGQPGTGGPSDGAGKPDVPGGELPEAERTQEQQLAGEPPTEEKREDEEGAAAGEPKAERAPDGMDGNDDEAQTTTPGRHRIAEADDGINL